VLGSFIVRINQFLPAKGGCQTSAGALNVKIAVSYAPGSGGKTHVKSISGNVFYL
jgi:hypothetical protein